MQNGSIEKRNLQKNNIKSRPIKMTNKNLKGENKWLIMD